MTFLEERAELVFPFLIQEVRFILTLHDDPHVLHDGQCDCSMVERKQLVAINARIIFDGLEDLLIRCQDRRTSPSTPLRNTLYTCEHVGHLIVGVPFATGCLLVRLILVV